MEINVTSSIVDNHAMPMCSIAASGSTAKSHRRNTGVLLGSCMVASASDGISGVCSVVGCVGVERESYPNANCRRHADANCRRFLVQVMKICLHVPTIGIAT